MKKEEKVHTCKVALSIIEIMSEVNRNGSCLACEWLVQDWKK